MDYKSLKDIIAEGESSNFDNPYDAYNRGRAGISGRKLKKPLSQMTIKEIMKLQSLPEKDKNRLFAVGRFQAIPDTLKTFVKKRKVDTNRKFDEEIQEELGNYLLEEKRKGLGDYLTLKSDDIDKAALDAAKEWASLPVPKGKKKGQSYYSGSANNKAHKTVEEVMKALKEAKGDREEIYDLSEIKNGVRTEDQTDSEFDAMVHGEDLMNSKLDRLLKQKNELESTKGPVHSIEDEQIPEGVAYEDGGANFPYTVPVTQSGTELTDDLGVQTHDTLESMEAMETEKEEPDMELAQVGPVEMESPDVDVAETIKESLKSEEESKKERKPLTMKSLEERYNQLMEADAKERQTAGWATAAMHIASLIDKASAEPIGITPINFQAGDSRAQMQNLLAMGRAKGLGAERPMTAYQKAMLAEQKATRDARDARSKAERESKERLAQLKLKEKSKGLDLTKGQEALDRAYAKEYADYVAAGGSKVVESDINKLDQIAKEMKEGKDMFTGPLDTLVEYAGGFDTVRSAINPRLQDIKSRLEQIIQQDLRKTLGAQFTEKEGKQFLERSFDPKLSYEQNAKRLADFINMVKSRADIAEKSAKYFEDKGTLKGFKGVEESGYPSEIETKIQRVMDRNPGRTREEIIKALKAAGKL